MAQFECPSTPRAHPAGWDSRSEVAAVTPSGLTGAGCASYTIQRRLHYSAEKNACERVCERACVRSPTRMRKSFNVCANA